MLVRHRLKVKNGSWYGWRTLIKKTVLTNRYGVFLGMVNGSFIRLLRVPLSVRNGLKVGVKRLNYIILRRTLDGNKKIVLSGI